MQATESDLALSWLVRQTNLTAEDFEALMLEVSAKKAFGLLIRQDQGDRLGGLDLDLLQTGLKNVTESLEKLLLGGFAPRLPAPSSEAAYNLVLDVEMAVNGFREAAAIPNLRSAQSGAIAVCEAAETLAKRYMAEGVEAIAGWLGARAEQANWQRALAAEAFGAAAAEIPGALSEATLQFEAVHGRLHDEIIPERQDLLEVWQEIDLAWASFKIQMEGQSVAAMSSALSELDVVLASSVPMFGMKDVPNPPTAPWMFAAMYGALGVTLTFCGCAGCYMFHRSRRQKVDDPYADGANYA
ncbi:GABBR2 [Symbiodinium sp. CCMP2592]|nr:GABBR2 [Symbiodinium sp. CCMP2592]